jgi:uncharacterized phage-associated protein
VSERSAIIDDMFDGVPMPAIEDETGYPPDMTLRAYDVAAEIRRRHPDIGRKKLHKLLYYCQAHHLATFGRPLFRESVSAWDMGPVIGRLWKAEKDGADLDPSAGLDEADLNTVGYVLSRYGTLTARDLENMTHGEDPWRRANENRMPGESALIRPEWIIEYFRSETADDDVASDLVVEFLAGAKARRTQALTFDTVEGIRSRAG